VNDSRQLRKLLYSRSRTQAPAIGIAVSQPARPFAASARSVRFVLVNGRRHVAAEF
jgi:hypothetical protein